MKRGLILVLDGGVMRGLFGAGVVTALQEADIYPRIHSIYAASAGAHNAAYFLARQTRLGSSIYYEDLAGERFIRRNGLIKTMLVMPWSLLTRRRIQPFVDLDYLETVEAKVKVMDLEAIRRQPVPFNIFVFNITDRRWEFLDGTDETLKKLKASSSQATFTGLPIRLAGKQYMDGGSLRNQSILHLIKTHPDQRFVFISSLPRSHANPFSLIINSWFSQFNTFFFGLRAGWTLLTKRQRIGFRALEAQPNVILVVNQLTYSPLTTNRAKLLKLYEHGLAEGRKLLNIL